MNINNSMVNILKLSENKENKVENNCLLTSTNRVNKQGQHFKSLINNNKIQMLTLLTQIPMRACDTHTHTFKIKSPYRDCQQGQQSVFSLY